MSFLIQLLLTGSYGSSDDFITCMETRKIFETTFRSVIGISSWNNEGNRFLYSYLQYLHLINKKWKLLDVANYCFKKESDEEGIQASKKNNKKNDSSKDSERAQYLGLWFLT